jgi:SAM-dependent methyltransferase
MTEQESQPAAEGFRPVRRAVSAVFRLAPALRPGVEKTLWRGFYELASLGPGGGAAALMNYGYAEPDAEAGTDMDRFGLALYAAVARGAELRDRDVLEVGCGRGGGAAHVFDSFTPARMTGIDLARTAIGHARRRHARPGLSFRVGDAQQLPFPDASFDVAINVESSHCYPDVARFLSEVARVLRPGGMLLMADFRGNGPAAQAVGGGDLEMLRSQISGAGFQTLAAEDITPCVIRSLSLGTPAVRDRVARRVPRPLRRHALEFSAIEGSAIYRSFVDRERTYMRFSLLRA